MTSKHKLYALGETLGECVTMRKLGGGYRCGGGGGSSNSSSDTKTENTDNRQAVQDGVGLSGSNNNTVTYNSTDAVKAIANMGADTIASMGESVVQLHRDAVAADVTAWDTTVRAGAQLVDKLISANSAVTQQAIASYQPTDNKAQETAMAVQGTALKLGMVAAAGVAAAVIISRMSK